MKQILLGALIVIASACAWNIARPPSTEERAWDLACELSQLRPQQCGDAPQVVTSDNVFEATRLFGALGFFIPGEAIVYMRPMHDADKYLVVLVHEMVHFINDRKARHQENSCDNEASAFKAGDEVAIRLGRLDLVRGDFWWIPYGQCQNYGGLDGTS